jgi:hypothetical protein
MFGSRTLFPLMQPQIEVARVYHGHYEWMCRCKSKKFGTLAFGAKAETLTNGSMDWINCAIRSIPLGPNTSWSASLWATVKLRKRRRSISRWLPSYPYRYLVRNENLYQWSISGNRTTVIWRLSLRESCWAPNDNLSLHGCCDKSWAIGGWALPTFSFIVVTHPFQITIRDFQENPPEMKVLMESRMSG